MLLSHRQNYTILVKITNKNDVFFKTPQAVGEIARSTV